MRRKSEKVISVRRKGRGKEDIATHENATKEYFSPKETIPLFLGGGTKKGRRSPNLNLEILNSSLFHRRLGEIVRSGNRRGLFLREGTSSFVKQKEFFFLNGEWISRR